MVASTNRAAPSHALLIFVVFTCSYFVSAFAQAQPGEATLAVNAGDAARHRQNFAEAKRQYQLGCDGGNFVGCYSLASIYAGNLAGPPDYGNGARLYARACRGGFSIVCARREPASPPVRNAVTSWSAAGSKIPVSQPLPADKQDYENPNYPIGGSAAPIPAGVAGELVRSCTSELKATGNMLSTPQEWPKNWAERYSPKAVDIASMQSLEQVRFEYRRLMRNSTALQMLRGFDCMLTLRARQFGGTVDDLRAGIAAPASGSVRIVNGSETPPAAAAPTVSPATAEPKGQRIYDTPQAFAKAIERGEAKLPPGMVIRNGMVVSATAPSVPVASSNRVIANANRCITITYGSKVYNGVSTKTRIFRNTCSYDIMIFALTPPQTTYHLYFPLKPGATGAVPYATMDGKPYAQPKSIFVCRDGKNYSGDNGPTPGSFECRGP